MSMKEPVVLVKCECTHCSEPVFVAIGQINLQELHLLDFTRMRTICPLCKRRFLIKPKEKRGPYTKIYKSYLLDNRAHVYLPSVKDMQEQLRVADSKLQVMVAAAKNAVRAWRRDWGRAVMPTQMGDLYRTIKQVTEEET